MIRCFDDLIEFLYNFHAPLGQYLPSIDIPQDLPQPLTRLYTEFGSLIDIETPEECLPFATQDSLNPVKYLKKIDDTYEFAWENQGNWSCRTPVGAKDPPVYSNSQDVWATTSQGFQPICDSLEHFLTTFCLQEAVYSSPNYTPISLSESAFFSTLEPLWLNGFYVDGEPSHDFYICKNNPDILMMQLKYEAGSGYIGSYTKDFLEKLNSQA